MKFALGGERLVYKADNNYIFFKSYNGNADDGIKLVQPGAQKHVTCVPVLKYH